MGSRKERELAEIIEQQKEQLGQYKTKLRDVIQAYKGIVKEKEALEASLKALADSKVSQNEEIPSGSTDLAAESCITESEETGVENRMGEDGPKAQETIRQLKAQLATLSSSIATITAEKSRSEANFQSDRKRLLQEKDDLEKSLAAACNQAEIAAQTLKQQINELKAALSFEKSERSNESTTNQVIYRELQKTIAEERQKRESLEAELAAKSSRLAQVNATSNQLEVAERKIRDLSNELEATKIKLRASEQKLEQPSPHLIQLQSEMSDLKLQHRLAIQQEQRNAADAQETARQLAAAHEQRVATLEARLAEFSERIGAYDRLRQQDLATVSKLKEQLQSVQKQASYNYNVEEEEYDVEKLIDKMKSLQSRLVEASQKTSIPANLLSLAGTTNQTGSDVDAHEACQLEMQQLKQELDWYKCEEERRADEGKVGNRGDQDADQELDQLRVEVQFLRGEIEHAESRHKAAVQKLHDAWSGERSAWKQETGQLERSWRARAADLEQQLQKQRERSHALLQEKDDELDNLRKMVNIKSVASPASPVRQPLPAKDAEERKVNDEWPESLAPFASMTVGASASGGQILHYVEELARKEVEIQGLRKAKHQLEGALREMQMAAVTMEHKVAEQKRHLHEELARLERNQSREGANLEYLKNVLLEFLLRNDAKSQSHMFNAMAACLHFSPKEIQRVHQHHPKWKVASQQQQSPHS